MTDTTGRLSEDLAAIDALANAALPLWRLPHDAHAHRINVSENVTYLVEGEGDQAILRIHREGYHSRRAIECELDWSAALRAESPVCTPAWRTGRNGEAIQSMGHADLAPRHMVLFDFAPGAAPQETQDLTPSFRDLGAIAARTHLHSIAWRRPEPFQRLSWNLPAVFGRSPTWGDWRHGPGIDVETGKTLERAEARITTRLTAYGQNADRFGLIHADMRLANLILGPDGPVLIDFDDCGFGWFIFDFAAAISFIEDSPQIPALKNAWLAGYQTVRPLHQEDIAQIDTLVMLRRLSLLAWIGSHIEAPEPQAMAPDFAETSATLAEVYLTGSE